MESGTANVEVVGIGSGDLAGILMLGSIVSPEDEPVPVEATVFAFGPSISGLEINAIVPAALPVPRA